MNPNEKRETALKQAREVAEKARDEKRALTDEERKTFDSCLTTADEADKEIKAGIADQARMARLSELVPAVLESGAKAGEQPAGSLGAHFIKHAGAQLALMKGRSGATVDAPEYKANTDAHLLTTNDVFQTPVLTEFDRTTVRPFLYRLVVADLLGAGAMDSDKNAISYFVEGALEGTFATVAEGGTKPQLHIVQPTLVTDALKKIAGFIRNSDEMVEDLAFFMSEINSRLIVALQRFEETQLLSGAGTGSQILGLLNRSGLQTEASASAADNADSLFRAITKVSTGSGLDADAIVMNPTDYQNLRLKKDANAQYYGGGYFQGEYGVGGFSMNPPIWGLTTVTTPAVTAGTAVVGALKQAATVYRKGGLRVESTNSHASDFIANMVTTRVEERIALAVRYPSAIVKVTLSAL